jgi:SulP family sulfate permease
MLTYKIKSNFSKYLLGSKTNNTHSQIKLSSQLIIDLLTGLTVALALVPEAIAFAFVAGVEPLVGLYAAFIVGLITALIGGRPAMISGATGALAVVMVSLVASHGVQYLFATVILMGIIQLFAGVMRWGKFIRMVPKPVMLGFVNGLAIVIGLAQINQFRVIDETGVEQWLSGNLLLVTVLLVVATMVIIWISPRITKSIPAPLIAMTLITGLSLILQLDIQFVGDLASLAGGLPELKIPVIPLSFETLIIILPYALILAAIGLIESLLTLNLVGEITNQKGGASQECVAQGTANIVTGFFGGMGGCAMIGQSMINVKSGGRTRVSGISAAIFLMLFILYGSHVIELIPIAALTGVMLMVVVGTFAWNSIKSMALVPRSDAIVTIVVTLVTVWQDLAIAVIVGVIMSALVYAWNAAKRIEASIRPSEQEAGAVVYDIQGPLFFGSISSFQELFDVQQDPEKVIIDFSSSRIVDQSALQAIEDIAQKYSDAGKQVFLRHLSRNCHSLLSKSGQLIINSDDDPDYEIAADYGVKLNIFGNSH